MKEADILRSLLLSDTDTGKYFILLLQLEHKIEKHLP